MGLFSSLFKKSSGPYKNESLNKIYNLLFCDNIDLYRSETEPIIFPWDILLSNKPYIDKLQDITIDKDCETRQKILAYNLLAANGVTTNQKELLGVIVEVALPQGLDVLAAFSDGTARYINYSEKFLVWETRTEQSNNLIAKLFSDSTNVVNQIGPWNENRKPAPTGNMIRLTFLVSNGLYFGEGPFNILQNDPMGGPVVNSATELMTYLTKQTPKITS